MLDEYFVLDGVDSRTLGIALQSSFSFSSPEPKVSTVSVPGRNGDLVFDDGGYNNITGEAVCYVLDPEDVSSKMGAINAMLNHARGYCRLFVSNDPDHYRMARITQLTGFSTRLMRLSPFTITFDCKPQRYLITSPTVSVKSSPGTVYNPTGFGALPRITVYGSGAGTVGIGSKIVTISQVEDGMIIDCESQNAYHGSTNKNGVVQCDDFPVIEAGQNTVEFTGGVTSVSINPRWWEL